MRPECTTTTTSTNLNACGDSFYEKGGEETKEGERGERERGKRTSGDDGGTQIKLKCPPFTWDAATGVAVVAPILPFAIVVVVPLAVAPF